jgi:DNA-binding transcriptional MerR regulator
MVTTGDIMRQFDISRQTVSNWCHEFERFLSPTANPPVGAQRRFADDDLKVFALIHRQKRAGLTFEEIAASLAIGERDEPPTDIVTTSNAAVERLQNRIIALENQIRETERRADRAEGQNDLLLRLLKEQLADKDAEIARLNRLLGQGG